MVGNKGLDKDLNKETSVNTGLNAIEMSEEGYTVPKNVASTGHQFREFYSGLKSDHSTRFEEYKKLFKQYSGARPRDPAKLKALGRQYLSNINNGHARTLINRYFSAEFNLLHHVQSPLDVVVRMFARAGAPNGARIDNRIARAISRAFKETYASWPDYDVNLDILRLDRIIYGFGITLREIEKGYESWKFRTISPEHFLCPLNTQLRSTAIGKFCITHSMTIQELWRIYNQKSPYWNKKALGELLWRESKYGASGNSQTSDFSGQLLDLQKKSRNYGGNFEDYKTDEVALVSCYFKEFDGKWSHGIIHENYAGSGDAVFFRDRQYQKFEEFCQIWPFEPGQLYLHSVRGLGYRIYQPVEMQTRLDNVLLDQTHLDATIFVRTRAGRGKELKSLDIVPGAINDIGEAEVVQQLTGAKINQTIAVNQYQERILERNVQFEQQDVDNPDNKYRTLGEVGLLAAKDAIIAKPQVSFFYKQVDIHVKDTLRLIFDKKKDEFFEAFKEEVLFDLSDLQIPGLEEILFGKIKSRGLDGLPKWLKVRASRSTASGSQVADILATNRMITLAPFMQTDKRHTFLQRATAAYSDYEDAELYFPDEDRPDIFTEAMQKAVIENGLLKSGHEIPVSPMDSHRDETPVHFQECMKILEIWGQNQMSAIDANSQLQQLYPHALAHYTMLSQDPWSKAIFEALAPQRGVIENQFRLIAANAEAEQKAVEAERQRRQLEMDELRLQEDPKRLKVVLDSARADKAMLEDQKRKSFANNLTLTKFAVTQDLENTLMVQDFALEQARKDAETASKLKENKNTKSSK